MPMQPSLFDLPTQVSKNLINAQAKFDAASRTRRLASWIPPNTGPRAVIAELVTIRARARDAGRNDAPMAAATRHIVTDIMGTGIMPRPATKKAKLKAVLTELWTGFSKECDADEMLDFYGLEALVATTVEESGEVLIRLRPRYLEDGLTVPMQLQILEADLCPMSDFDSHPALPKGNVVRQGREIDYLGRRVAFWMFKEHPGDAYTGSIDASVLYRIPAAEVISVYYVKRPGQLRGIPEGTSVMVKSRLVGDYDDAVVEKAKLQNLFVGVITKQPPTAGMEGMDPLTGQYIEQSGDGLPMVTLQPGATIELAPGEKMDFSTPPATGVGYNDFMRQQFLTIAAGRGLPYEILTGDIVNISDRTLRVIIQQYRRNIEQKQWLTYIPQFCQKVWDAFVNAAALEGSISLRDVAEAKKVEWIPQAWAYIHPVQDVQSRVAEIAAGITSRTAVIGGRGNDPEIVDRQRAEDQQREKDLGIVTASAAPAPGTPPTEAPTKPTKGK